MLSVQFCDSVMGKKFAGQMSQVLARDIEDQVEVYSSDESVILDKTPAQVRRHLSIFLVYNMHELCPPDS